MGGGAAVLGENGVAVNGNSASTSQSASDSTLELKRLVGYKGFKRHNPKSDRFTVHKFHHVEFWCNDATNTYKRFSYGLGMQLVGKSDLSTGNSTFASYVTRSLDLTFTFTAPYGAQPEGSDCVAPAPWFKQQEAHEFVAAHGLAVRAIGLLVEDAQQAYHESVANGGIPVLEPTSLQDHESGGEMVVAEIKLFGDSVLRFVSGTFMGPFLPNYEAVPHDPASTLGLARLDHAVSNTWNLLESANYLVRATGFHEFAEFVAEDVGTVESGLNSLVLASNNEMVLLPINEPTYGTKRKSQIQTYLEQNGGPGVQHMALKTEDIFRTVREMRRRAEEGPGFDFMPRASGRYYRELPSRIGDELTPEQYKEVEELGLLVDKDDQGVLLQIFTRPLGDRPTVFIEIIQRVGCMHRQVDLSTHKEQLVQSGGCGGFGKGNFSELFRSIEDYERTLKV